MPKLSPIEENDQIVGYFFDCPGCQGGHAVHIKPHKNPVSGASWDYNGNINKPSFTPSILSKVSFSQGSNKPEGICHIYVTNGQIQFLSDCTHSLAGKTVDMEEI